MHSIHFAAVTALLPVVQTKTWNNTGKGSIIFEEAISLPYPELPVSQSSPPVGQTIQELISNLADLHNQRLQWMDQAGVDYMVLSLVSPGIQGLSNVSLAEEVATRANNGLAAMIANNTMRFGAFAALSMHNATQAAIELRRCVEDLGFHGALLNDFQQAGADNNTLHYYDTSDYDPFWAVVVDLDVPVYFHPRGPPAQIQSLEYAHSPWLLGPGQQFAAELSTHVAGLCANGVFDRFPELKVVVGHMGERLPSDFWRIDQMLARRLSQGMPMRRNFSDYWKTNIYETTSGNFATELLDFHLKVLGSGRILYSVDYLFVMMQQGADWIKALPHSEKSKLDLVRNHAIKLLKLDA